MLVLVAAIGVWVVYSFAQEAYLNYRLSAQASALRQQNASLKVQEAGYHRDIVASMAGAAAEEEARINGYARPDERVYVVGRPASNAASPATNQKRVAKVEGTGSDVWQVIGRWVADLWHR